MRSILHNLILAPVVMAAAALVTTSAMAEATVNVPFSFTVAGKYCPAGPYLVQRDLAHNFVTLKSKNAPLGFNWLIGPGNPGPTDTKVTLRFDDWGANHALQSVQYGSLITSKLDKGASGREHNPVRIVQGQ